MSNYNTKTIGELLKNYLDETGETLEVFSANAGISLQFVKQMVDDRRNPSTKPENTNVIDKISAYTGESFDEVYNAAVATERKIEANNEAKRKENVIRYAAEERAWLEKKKARSLQQDQYIKSLSIKTGYEITVLKEKEPIRIYGDYKVVELGGSNFIQHNNCLYGISYITKIETFEFVVNADGETEKAFSVSDVKNRQKSSRHDRGDERD